jgi:hypothetical protein
MTMATAKRHEGERETETKGGPFPVAEEPPKEPAKEQPSKAPPPPPPTKEEKEQKEKEEACLKESAEKDNPFRYGVESLPGAGAPHPEEQKGFQAGGFAAEAPKEDEESKKGDEPKKRSETGGTRNPV